MKRSVAVSLLTASTLVLGLAATQATAADPGDAALARDSLRTDLTGVPFYMTMIDRYANGDPRNDRGGLTTGTRLENGFDPTDKQFFHGGDLAGLSSKVDYLAGLGVKALWVNPPFRNRWVVDLGPAGAFAAYHGYAITDFTSFDPHFGTAQEMRALVDKAHAHGIKVFFDITAQYTADVITFAGEHPYKSLQEAPYKDAAGKPFDIRAMAGRPDFPKLSVDKSFPYKPVLAPAVTKLKRPAWLNDPTLYHNRGDATVYEGEQLLYGDFFGLDDLMTEHPRVVAGMQQIYSSWIDQMDIDGYRVDTAKHVNDEFWQAFAPAVRAHAEQRGKKDFFIFGEVYSGDPELTSHYSTAAKMQSVLDFPFQGAARDFVSGKGSSLLGEVLESDDLYTDADSNAYSLTTFVGNHDMGRLAMMLKQDHPDISEQELLARVKLGNELLFLWRGNPVIYYGDEQGFAGTGGDAETRQDMFPTQVADHKTQDQVGTDKTPADDNFDPTHPLYRQLRSLAGFTASDPVWKRGNQVLRLASGDLLAYSRIDRTTGREFLVVANSSTSAKTVDVPVGASGTQYERIRPALQTAGVTQVTSAEGTVKLTVPPLSAAVYRSRSALPADPAAPKPTLALGGNTTQDGRTELVSTVPGVSYAQATFALRVQGQQKWTVLGTDDAPPYRVFSKLPTGKLELRVVVKDRQNRIGAASLLR
ncbi:alpha-amylase family glycosyl hydrolase [Kribbella sp. CA-294648]|uniref:alpha-amylase family glycosyl hydrolase n=1 Tax=Kribbella sp. CA-294648 TaxID=3239948 RepID=UPI003D922FF0